MITMKNYAVGRSASACIIPISDNNWGKACVCVPPGNNITAMCTVRADKRTPRCLFGKSPYGFACILFCVFFFFCVSATHRNALMSRRKTHYQTVLSFEIKYEMFMNEYTIFAGSEKLYCNAVIRSGSSSNFFQVMHVGRFFNFFFLSKTLLLFFFLHNNNNVNNNNNNNNIKRFNYYCYVKVVSIWSHPGN